MSVEQKRVQLTQNQLVQMAQQEEHELMNKQRMLERIRELLRETIQTKETLSELKTTKGKIQISIGATVLIEVNALAK